MSTTTKPRLDPSNPPHQRPSWGRRIGWLCLIWLASIAALGLATLLLRLCMRLAGLHS